jgi:putative FmdB family regulatory protein
MPNYDYRCKDCHKRFQVFQAYSEYGNKVITCTICGSTHVMRIINRVRTLRSDDSRMEHMADPSQFAGLDEDPRAMGKMMRQMGKDVGEDIGPEFDEVVGRLEAGQTPEQIENELPELGAETGDGFNGMDID